MRRSAGLAACLALLAAAVPATASAAGWLPARTLTPSSGSLNLAGFAAGGAGHLGFAGLVDPGTSTQGVEFAVGDADGTLGDPVRLSDPADQADYPQIAVDGSGGAVAAWLESDGTNWRVKASSRPAGGSWATPTTLSDAGQNAGTLSLKVNREGDAVAIWQRGRGTGAVVQSSVLSAGGSWSPAADLSAPGAFAPRVAIDGAGDATAVWIVGDDTYIGGSGVGYADRAAGAAWSPPAFIAEADAHKPAVDVTPDGQAVAIWLAHIGISSQPKVRAVTRAPGGTWDAPVTIGGGSVYDDQPAVAIDDDGTATALFGDGSADWVARHAPGAAWTPARLVGGRATDAHAQFSDAYDANVVSGAHGETLGSWRGVNHGGLNQYGEAITRNTADDWSAPIGFYNAHLTTAMDDEGNGYVVWPAGGGALTLRIHSSGDVAAAGPSVAITAPDTAVTGDSVSVSATETIGSSALAGSTVWDFGDGTTATGASVTHTYTTAGTYTVHVTITDANGLTASAQRAIKVADPAPPTVAPSIPATGTTGSAVQMTATATPGSYALEGTLGWDFGDGTTGDGTSVTHTYAAAGSYTVRVTARDSHGLVGSAQRTIAISDPPPPPGPRPVAAYSFENGSGSTLTDVTGNGHTGSIREATWTTTGKHGKALKFDGKNDWVTIADAPDLRLTTGMTLEAWVNPTKATDWRTAIMKERPGNLDYALYASGQAKPSVYANTVGGMASATGPKAAAVNTWTHLAATFDGTTVRLYVNGAQVASTAQSGALKTSSGALHLGGNGVWGEWFVGQMDDVRIYNQALTAAQIQTDMNTAVG